jgi:3-deoxy-D-manno-octulosonic-acid transferase
VETDGAVMVNSANEVESALEAILNDPVRRAKMGETARQFVANQQGATARTLDVLDELLRLGRLASRAA